MAMSFTCAIRCSTGDISASLAKFANAHGSMWGAALVAIPALFFFPIHSVPTPGIMAAALALGVLCTGVGYIIYFKLVEDVGATSALTVTFLIPLFGILWGVLFLGEIVGWYTLAGAAIVLAGTALVTGFMPRFGRAGATDSSHSS